MAKRLRLTCPIEKSSMEFDQCRFDFRIDSKNGLTPSKRKKSERRNVNYNTLFKCKVCGSLFDSRPALLEHKLIHSEYKCKECDARFAKKTWLKEHMCLIHGIGKVRTGTASARSTFATLRAHLLSQGQTPQPRDDNDSNMSPVDSPSDLSPGSITFPTVIDPLSPDSPPPTLVDPRRPGLNFEEHKCSFCDARFTSGMWLQEHVFLNHTQELASSVTSKVVSSMNMNCVVPVSSPTPTPEESPSKNQTDIPPLVPSLKVDLPKIATTAVSMVSVPLSMLTPPPGLNTSSSGGPKAQASPSMLTPIVVAPTVSPVPHSTPILMSPTAGALPVISSPAAATPYLSSVFAGSLPPLTIPTQGYTSASSGSTTVTSSVPVPNTSVTQMKTGDTATPGVNPWSPRSVPLIVTPGTPALTSPIAGAFPALLSPGVSTSPSTVPLTNTTSGTTTTGISTNTSTPTTSSPPQQGFVYINVPIYLAPGASPNAQNLNISSAIQQFFSNASAGAQTGTSSPSGGNVSQSGTAPPLLMQPFSPVVTPQGQLQNTVQTGLTHGKTADSKEANNEMSKEPGEISNGPNDASKETTPATKTEAPAVTQMYVHVPLQNLMPVNQSLSINNREPVNKEEQVLDFSKKAPKTDVLSNSAKSNYTVFSTGIKDPSSTLFNDATTGAAVDLTCKQGNTSNLFGMPYNAAHAPEPMPGFKSLQCKMEDDRLAMLQQYGQVTADSRPSSDENLLMSSLVKSSDGSIAEDFGSKLFKKKGKGGGLNKMVEKLWQSKLTKEDPMSSESQVLVMQNESQQIVSMPGLGLQETARQSDVLDLTVKEEIEDPYFGLQEQACVQNEMSDILSGRMNLSSIAHVNQLGQSAKESGFCAIKFHTCRVCKQLFYSAEEMWEHAVTHEDFHKYRCGACKYVTACRSELVQHKLSVHGMDMPGLSGRVKTKHGPSSHTSHGKPVINMDTTRITIPSSKADTPSSHHHISHKRGRLVCDYNNCGKSFKEWRHLKVHQTLHTGEKPLSCQLCDYACRHRSSMNWHMKSKHGLEKTKTQGNRTVYVDTNGQVVCGWSDEANREVNFLEPHQRLSYNTQDMDCDGELPPGYSESNSICDDSSGLMDIDQDDDSLQLCTRSPSCAPSEARSINSINVEDPTTLTLQVQKKMEDYPLNMAVKIESLIPEEDMVDEDGNLTHDVPMGENGIAIEDGKISPIGSPGSQCPSNAPSTVSSLSSDTFALLPSEARQNLVMTHVPSPQGIDLDPNKGSMMKFKLKYLTAPKLHMCKICSNMFDSVEKMWEHRMDKHKDCMQINCDTCGFKTDRMEDLKCHMMSTHGTEVGDFKDFICFICGKGYSSRTALNHHMMRHTEEGGPEYDCPYESCMSKLHSKGALKVHIRRVHLKMSPKHQCPEEGCQRRFDSPAALRNHKVLHTDERPIVCEVPGCDKTFRETKHLKVHMMQHTEVKPLKCDLCEYTCRQRNSINWHMRAKHGLEKVKTSDGRTLYVS